jgi:cytochrome P450 family 26 subfamily A
MQGYQIPKGWLVAFSIRETQAISELFEKNADEFQPERWDKEREPETTCCQSCQGHQTHQDTDTCIRNESDRVHVTTAQSQQERFGFIPFGRGARSCVGKMYARLVLKVLVVEMVRGCSWRLLNEDVVFKRLPMPHPADGLPMRVTPR